MRIKFGSFIFMLISAISYRSSASNTACDRALAEYQLTLNDFDYKIWGEANKQNGTVILIHGLGSAWQSFSNLAPLLAQQYQVVAYSQLGHGKSWGDRLDFSNQRMAEDLSDLMYLLHIDQAHILGHSLGTRTAIKFASLFSGKTLSVILEDHEFKARKSSAPDYAITDPEQLKNFPKVFDSKESALKALTGLTGSEEAAKNLVQWKTTSLDNGKILLNFQPHVFQIYKTQANQEDLGSDLNSIKAPSILVLADPQQSDMTEAGFAHFQKHSPHTPVVRLPGAAHSIHQTHLQEFYEIVRKFLDQSF